MRMCISIDISIVWFRSAVITHVRTDNSWSNLLSVRASSMNAFRSWAVAKC